MTPAPYYRNPAELARNWASELTATRTSPGMTAEIIDTIVSATTPIIETKARALDLLDKQYWTRTGKLILLNIDNGEINDMSDIELTGLASSFSILQRLEEGPKREWVNDIEPSVVLTSVEIDLDGSFSISDRQLSLVPILDIQEMIRIN